MRGDRQCFWCCSTIRRVQKMLATVIYRDTKATAKTTQCYPMPKIIYLSETKGAPQQCGAMTVTAPARLQYSAASAELWRVVLAYRGEGGTVAQLLMELPMVPLEAGRVAMCSANARTLHPALLDRLPKVRPLFVSTRLIANLKKTAGDDRWHLQPATCGPSFWGMWVPEVRHAAMQSGNHQSPETAGIILDCTENGAFPIQRRASGMHHVCLCI